MHPARTSARCLQACGSLSSDPPVIKSPFTCAQWVLFVLSLVLCAAVHARRGRDWVGVRPPAESRGSRPAIGLERHAQIHCASGRGHGCAWHRHESPRRRTACVCLSEAAGQAPVGAQARQCSQVPALLVCACARQPLIRVGQLAWAETAPNRATVAELRQEQEEASGRSSSVPGGGCSRRFTPVHHSTDRLAGRYSCIQAVLVQ